MNINAEKAALASMRAVLERSNTPHTRKPNPSALAVAVVRNGLNLLVIEDIWTRYRYSQCDDKIVYIQHARDLFRKAEALLVAQ